MTARRTDQPEWRVTWLVYFGLFLAFMIPAVLWAADRAQAATFTTHEENEMGCTMTMEGAIVEGDADRFRHVLAEQILAELLDTGESFAPQTLCLDSPGGSFLEAMSIADTLAFCYLCDDIDAVGKGLLVDRYPVSASVRWTPTAIGSQQVCESACAIIFMAGGVLMPPGDPRRAPSRFLHIDGRLGFHSPAARLPQGTYSQDDVEAAFDGAVKIISFLRDRLEGYHFPVSLFGHMLATPASEMFYVETVGQLAQWSIATVGMPEISEFNDFHVLRVCRNLFFSRDSGSWRSTYQNAAPQDIRSDTRKTYYGHMPNFVDWPPTSRQLDELQQRLTDRVRNDLFKRDKSNLSFFSRLCGAPILNDSYRYGWPNILHLFFPPYVTLTEVRDLVSRNVSNGALDASLWLGPVMDVFDATCLVYRDRALVSETDCAVTYETSERLDGLVVRSTASVSVFWPVVTRHLGRLSSCPDYDDYATFSVSQGEMYYPDRKPLERLPANQVSDVCRRDFSALGLNLSRTTAFAFCVAPSEDDVFCLVDPSQIPASNIPELEARGI